MLFDAAQTRLISVPEGMRGAAVLPDSLAAVPAYVFSRCTKLSAITFEGSTAQLHFSSENGILYNKDKTNLVAAPVSLGATATIAPECQIISEGAFVANTDLTTIVISGAVSEIATGETAHFPVFVSDISGEDAPSFGAFSQQTIDTAKVVINAGESVTEGANKGAGQSASEDELALYKQAWQAAGFMNFASPVYPGQTIAPSDENAGFKFVLLDNFTLSVGWQEGSNNQQASERIDIPTYGEIDGVRYSVTEIADEGFASQTSIKSVNIPESITRIGSNAFAESGIQAISIPGSVTEIEAGAFSECDSLSALDLSEGLQIVGKSAFAGIAANTIILPATVKSVGDYAFANSPNLETILALGSIENISPTALSENTNVKVYVPYAKSEEYAWALGAPAAGNHLLAYGVDIQDAPVTLEEGQTVNLFDNGGYLKAPEGFEVNYSYKAKSLSVDSEGNVEAKQAGSSNVEVSISLSIVQNVPNTITSKEAKLTPVSFASTDTAQVTYTLTRSASGSYVVEDSLPKYVTINYFDGEGENADSYTLLGSEEVALSQVDDNGVSYGIAQGPNVTETALGEITGWRSESPTGGWFDTLAIAEAFEGEPTHVTSDMDGINMYAVHPAGEPTAYASTITINFNGGYGILNGYAASVDTNTKKTGTYQVSYESGLRFRGDLIEWWVNASSSSTWSYMTFGHTYQTRTSFTVVPPSGSSWTYSVNDTTPRNIEAGSTVTVQFGSPYKVFVSNLDGGVANFYGYISNKSYTSDFEILYSSALRIRERYIEYFYTGDDSSTWSYVDISHSYKTLISFTITTPSGSSITQLVSSTTPLNLSPGSTIKCNWGPPYCMNVNFNGGTCAGGNAFVGQSGTIKVLNTINSGSTGMTLEKHDASSVRIAYYVPNGSSTVWNYIIANRPGYSFVSWTAVAPNGVSTTFSVSDTGQKSVSPGSTITANWSKNAVYDVTLNPNGGSGGDTHIYQWTGKGFYGVSNPTDSTAAKTSIIIPTAPTGYTFGGYSSDGTANNLYINASGNIVASNTTFTGNATLKAYWKVNTYTVVRDSNFASGGIGNSESFGNETLSGADLNATVSLPNSSTNTGENEVKYQGHKLKSGEADQEAWASEASGSGTKFTGEEVSLASLLPFAQKTADCQYTITLYAQWDIFTYNITYSKGDLDKHSDAVLSGADDTGGLYSASFTLPDDIKQNDFGYAFSGWVATIDGVDCAIGKTFGTSDGLTNPTKISDLLSAAEGQANVFPDDGATITLTAQWSPIAYTLVYNADSASNLKGSSAKPGISVSSNTFTIEDVRANGGAGNDNSKIKQPNLPYFGYDFDGFSGGIRDTKISNLKENTQITEDIFKKLFCESDDAIQTQTNEITLSASWTPWQYTITWNGNSGKTSDGQTSVSSVQDYDKQVVVPTFMRDGYTFAGYKTEDSPSGKLVSSSNVWEIVAAFDSATSATGAVPIEIFATWSEDADGGKYIVEFWYQDPQDGTFKRADADTLELSAPITSKPSIAQSDAYYTSDKYVNERRAKNDTFYVFDKDNANNNLTADSLTTNSSDTVLKAYYKLALQATLSAGAYGAFGTENLPSITLPSSGYYDWGECISQSELNQNNVLLNTNSGLHATDSNRLKWEAVGWPDDITSTKLDSDKTFSAQWQEIAYTLTYAKATTDNGSKILNFDSSSEDAQDSLDVVLTYQEVLDGASLKTAGDISVSYGFCFDGWYSDNSSSDAIAAASFNDVFKAAADEVASGGFVSADQRRATVYGKCRANVYTINFYRTLDTQENTLLSAKVSLGAAADASNSITLIDDAYMNSTDELKALKMYGYSLGQWRDEDKNLIGLAGDTYTSNAPAGDTGSLQDFLAKLGGDEAKNQDATLNLFAGWTSVYRVCVPIDSSATRMTIDVIKPNEAVSDKEISVYNYSPAALKLSAKSAWATKNTDSSVDSAKFGEDLANTLFGASNLGGVNFTFNGIDIPLVGSDSVVISDAIDGLSPKDGSDYLYMSGLKGNIGLHVEDSVIESVISNLVSANEGRLEDNKKVWGSLSNIVWTLDLSGDYTQNDVYMFDNANSSATRLDSTYSTNRP